MDPVLRPPLLARVRPAYWRALDALAAGIYGLAALMLLAKHAHRVLALLGALAGATAVAWPVAWRRQRPLGSFTLSLAALSAVAAAQPRSPGRVPAPSRVTGWSCSSRTVKAACSNTCVMSSPLSS